MSFEVKITAATLGELGDKLLAMGAQLLAPPAPGAQGTVSAIMPEVAEMQKVAPKRAAPKAVEPEPAAEEPQPEAVSTPAQLPEEPAAEAEAAPAEIDFDKDVAPRVLAVVQAKGKPVMQEILAEFGVERASQIEASLLPELIEVLDKELAE